MVRTTDSLSGLSGQLRKWAPHQTSEIVSALLSYLTMMPPSRAGHTAATCNVGKQLKWSALNEASIHRSSTYFCDRVDVDCGEGASEKLHAVCMHYLNARRANLRVRTNQG